MVFRKPKRGTNPSNRQPKAGLADRGPGNIFNSLGWLEPEWIPRTQNEQADSLSCTIDYNDWGVDPLLFARFDSLWDPYSIDRFASFYNTQLPRFNSRYWNPGFEAVDVFTCDWSNQCNWLCLPPYLLPQTLKRVTQTGAHGTLIAP